MTLMTHTTKLSLRAFALNALALKKFGLIFALTLHNQASRISLLVLVAFLLSIFSHTTEHLAQTQHEQALFYNTTVTATDASSDQGIILELQDCQLCQHSIDSPPKPPQLVRLVAQNFYQQQHHKDDAVIIVSDYIQPQLRAPPINS